MKKKIMILTLMLFLILPIEAYAESTSVHVNIDGKIKKGEEINITINAKDLQGLYAASVSFIYDKSILNIFEISPGESITKHSDEIMEIGGEVDSENNKASYSFTFLGDKEGINDNAILANIKAKVLKDSDLKIDEDVLEVKLVKRVKDTVDNYEYKFIGYDTEDNKIIEEENKNNSSSGSTSSSKEEVSNDKKDDSSKTNENNDINNNSNVNSNDNNTDTNNQKSTSDDENSDENLENENDSSNKENENISSDEKVVDNSEEKNEEISDNSEKKENNDIIDSEKDIKSNSIITVIITLIVLSIFSGGMYYYIRKK